MKGPLGYGRYNDDPTYVGCPRAQTDMTPCVARDGHLACADDGNCVGCNKSPSALLISLQDAVGRERSFVGTRAEAADRLTSLVREVTEPTAV
jgi:hypothetical protein